MTTKLKTNMNLYQDVAAVILAAGKGTRLKNKPSNINKVSMKLDGKPMIQYTVDLLKKIGFGQIIAVVGFAKESVQAILGDQVNYAIQSQQLGTGHAAQCGLKALNSDINYVVVLHGDDSAFYPQSVISNLIDSCKDSNSAMSFLTVNKSDPTGIGRIIRDKDGNPKEIVEEKNADDKQKKITEVNLGMYCFKRPFIERYISQIDFNPVANERYLTDIIKVAYDNGFAINSVTIDNEEYWHGVNTDEQLLLARKKMAQRQNEQSANQ
jgi:bifunctional UDP-N-acetylglucosamine pyrophosphorylase/glucosamine-1-phosphate N-acetyltransferase